MSGDWHSKADTETEVVVIAFIVIALLFAGFAGVRSCAPALHPTGSRSS